MWNKEPKSIQEIIDKFPTEQKALKHLEQIRWDGNILSPFDATSKVYKCKGNKFRCKNTGKYFNAKTNTIYEGSRIPLVKWFCAIYAMNKEPRITSVKLAYLIDVTQRSAWYMIKRISTVLFLDEKDIPLKCIVALNDVLYDLDIKEVLKR